MGGIQSFPEDSTLFLFFFFGWASREMGANGTITEARTCEHDSALPIHKSDRKRAPVVSDRAISLLPICARSAFFSYLDQLLEFLLSLNHILSSNLMFCQSRYIPFHSDSDSRSLPHFARRSQTLNNSVKWMASIILKEAKRHYAIQTSR
jgi:hypothetical protein